MPGLYIKFPAENIQILMYHSLNPNAMLRCQFGLISKTNIDMVHPETGETSQ